MSTSEQKPPWLWIGLSAALLIAVVGVVIWAVGLQQDLDDANAQVETQAEQVEAQQEKVVEEADDLSTQIDELSTAVTTTSERLDQLIADGESSAEEIRTKAGGAADSADAARQKAADTQNDAREAIDALDTRLTELAAQIKAKLADVKAAAAVEPESAPEPAPTEEPTPKATPEGPSRRTRPRGHRTRPGRQTRANPGRGRQVARVCPSGPPVPLLEYRAHGAPFPAGLAAGPPDFRQRRGPCRRAPEPERPLLTQRSRLLRHDRQGLLPDLQVRGALVR